MRTASIGLVAVSLYPGAATAQLTDDLWDVSQGVVITGHSSLDHDAGQGVDARDAFGGAYTKLLVARGTVVFDDNQARDFVDWIEWRTPSCVAVSRVMVHLAPDSPSGERAVGAFQLFSRLGPGNPWSKVAGSSKPPTRGPFAARVEPAFAREFRAEFTRRPIPGGQFSGPRIVEIDATGQACPFVTTPPKSYSPCIGGDAAFSITAGGTGPLAFAWFRNGELLADGPRESGSALTGSQTARLTVSAAGSADEGAYWCVVSNSLGRITSEAAMLRACIADCDCNGMLTVDDYACFEARMAASDPRADLTGDGRWGPDDLARFRESFALCQSVGK